MNKTDMMDQPLSVGDWVWWFTGDSGGFDKELYRVVGETPQCVKILWSNGERGSIRKPAPRSLLIHREEWDDNHTCLIKHKIERYQEENQ